jgi:hypothetical protein
MSNGLPNKALSKARAIARIRVMGDAPRRVM